MRINRSILPLLMLLVPSACFAEEFFPGENLVTPYKLETDQYDVLSRQDRGLKSMMWRSKTKGMADSYVVNIFTTNASIQHERENQDAPGRKSCKVFDSVTLSPTINQNFESMMWRTQCSDGQQIRAQMLQLLIRGKDSLYYLQKIWRGNVDDAELQGWINQFSTVYVCDTRLKNIECPTEYTKAR